MSIYSLSYHSRNRIADLTFDTLFEIDKILAVSASRNTANEVTGALMFNEGRFIQILEGKKAAVWAIFESIRHDPRHSDVTVFTTQTSTTRRFTSWDMAFVGTTPAARAHYNNYTAAKEAWSKTFEQDKLCQLMLEMIDIDKRSYSNA